tara:strand:- start:796 stop:1710 length:915 start_codon:yes stop_codon:yes gene_type:complete
MKRGSLEYRTIGNTDLRVSVVGMDIWANAVAISSNHDEYDKIRFLQESSDLGVTLFDIGDSNKENYGEKLLSKSLKQHRHEMVVSAKCECICGTEQISQSTGRHGEDFSTEFIRRSCEDSLIALGTDYIDIYLIKCMPSHTYAHDTDIWLEALRSLVKEGKVRHIGVSIDSQLALIDKYLNNQADVILAPYSILNRDVLDQLGQDTEITNTSVLCKDSSGHMSLSKGSLLGVNSDLSNRVEKIKELAFTWDIKLEKIALDFCLRNPYVCSIFPVVEDTISLMSLCNAIDDGYVPDDLMIEVSTI